MKRPIIAVVVGAVLVLAIMYSCARIVESYRGPPGAVYAK